VLWYWLCWCPFMHICSKLFVFKKYLKFLIAELWFLENLMGFFLIFIIFNMHIFLTYWTVKRVLNRIVRLIPILWKVLGFNLGVYHSFIERNFCFCDWIFFMIFIQSQRNSSRNVLFKHTLALELIFAVFFVLLCAWFSNRKRTSIASVHIASFYLNRSKSVNFSIAVG